MKTLILLIAYALLSGLIGLLVCTWLLWKSKRPLAATIAAIVFFGGPPALYGYVYLRDKHAQTTYEEDVAYLKELCAKHGGDKIYRTVDDVQGVFQMKAYNPDQDFQWADQYGMVEPWALARGAESSNWWLGTRVKGYWFIEQQPGYGLSEGPPYRRLSLTSTATKVEHLNSDAVINAEGFVLNRKEVKVQALKSRYGYVTEDLTTPELRKRWIAGGKLKIIDLQTKEVLAERVEYYRATGAQVKMAWADGFPCPAGPPPAINTSTPGFILAVLRPPRAEPTHQQLLRIKAE